MGFGSSMSVTAIVAPLDISHHTGLLVYARSWLPDFVCQMLTEIVPIVQGAQTFGVEVCRYNL